jgi:glutathione S-transferase
MTASADQTDAADPGYTLHIGSRRYSSWSLRVWLAMRVAAIPFTESVIAFWSRTDRRAFRPEVLDRIAAVSPNRRVPALATPEVTLCESLAILEYLDERHPDRGLWPDDPVARARARMLSGAIHAGFHPTKLRLPFLGDGRSTPPRRIDDPVLDDEIAVLMDLLPPEPTGGAAGGFLFGRFTIADAMMAPLVMRFHVYGVAVPARLAAYIETILAIPQVQDWIAAATVEPERIPEIESIFERFPEPAPVEQKL